jgi:hypothetical protein
VVADVTTLPNGEVSWELPSSKTDQAALGASRSRKCSCGTVPGTPAIVAQDMRPRCVLLAQVSWVNIVFEAEFENNQHVPLFPTEMGDFIAKANVVNHMQPRETHAQPRWGIPVGRPRLQERHRKPPRHLRGGSQPYTVSPQALFHLQGHHKVPREIHGTFLSRPRRRSSPGNNPQFSQSRDRNFGFSAEVPTNLSHSPTETARASRLRLRRHNNKTQRSCNQLAEFKQQRHDATRKHTAIGPSSRQLGQMSRRTSQTT